ncbi:hypothetical protein DCAR_0104236 [Daucus carota subsp. sativus]|uniref:Uncharacterized protein n=1 Tax=Daucus carota subsp. sativus TaxID=79200 RepID=A0A166INL5_DAUCS|nr:hypothetical protein DCAR_0104236 [Daucus carota subsp. sativus]
MSVAVHPNDLLISTTTTHADNPRTIKDKYMCFNDCVIIFTVMACFVLPYLIIILFHIILNDKVKDLKVLEIDSLTASNFNLSSQPNQISADWNVQMSFKTMNKLGYFKFYRTKVSVYYDDKRIALKKIRSFYLTSKHPPMHFGTGDFSGSSGYIDDSVIRNIGRGIKAGTVRFNIVFEALVEKSVVKGHMEDDIVNHVGYCENVEMFFGLPNAFKARMLNGSQICQLHTKRRPHSLFDPYEPLCFCTSGGGGLYVCSPTSDGRRICV